MGLICCKWSSLNAPGTGKCHSHSILELGDSQVPSISPILMSTWQMLNPHSWTQKLKLARQEDISCLNSLGISNFRENLPSLPDGLASLSFWVDYGGSGLGQVDMSGGQMALPISNIDLPCWEPFYRFSSTFAFVIGSAIGSSHRMGRLGISTRMVILIRALTNKLSE